MSIRATVRVTGVAKNTIVKLLADLGQACADYQDIAFRNLDIKRVECDEIWSFCYAKAKNVPEEHKGTYGYSDVWTCTALDADTKPVPTWLVGERTTQDCFVFLRDLRSRMLPAQRIQLTTGGFGSYPPALARSGLRCHSSRFSLGGHAVHGVGVGCIRTRSGRILILIRCSPGWRIG